jgi:tetratricopeptide (TPR) repeat protein
VVARSQGNFDRAASLFADSLQRKRRLGDTRGIAATLSNLGILASDRGDLEAAAQLFAEALEIDESTGSAGAITVSCANLGSVLVRAGKTQQGLAQIRRALPGIAELRDPELVVEVLSVLAHVRLVAPDAGGATDAARLSLVAQELRQREGIPLREVERADVDGLLGRELAILGRTRSTSSELRRA